MRRLAKTTTHRFGQIHKQNTGSLWRPVEWKATGSLQLKYTGNEQDGNNSWQHRATVGTYRYGRNVAKLLLSALIYTANAVLYCDTTFNIYI
jgi:hypothetical protein